MQNYIGAKIIKAELSNLKEYKIKKYGENAIIDENDKNNEVYIIEYPPIGCDNGKPYLSCCPKYTFEAAYRLIDKAEIDCLNDYVNEAHDEELK